MFSVVVAAERVAPGQPVEQHRAARRRGTARPGASAAGWPTSMPWVLSTPFGVPGRPRGEEDLGDVVPAQGARTGGRPRRSGRRQVVGPQRAVELGAQHVRPAADGGDGARRTRRPRRRRARGRPGRPSPAAWRGRCSAASRRRWSARRARPPSWPRARPPGAAGCCPTAPSPAGRRGRGRAGPARAGRPAARASPHVSRAHSSPRPLGHQQPVGMGLAARTEGVHDADRVLAQRLGGAQEQPAVRPGAGHDAGRAKVSWSCAGALPSSRTGGGRATAQASSRSRQCSTRACADVKASCSSSAPATRPRRRGDSGTGFAAR